MQRTLPSFPYQLRVFVLLLVPSVVACGASTGADLLPGGVRAEPDAGVDAVANRSVEVSVEAPSFTACNCHHGFAPGIDGTAQIRVTNSGSGSVTLVPGAFVLRDEVSGKAYTTIAAVGGAVAYYSVENVPAVEGNPGTPPSFNPVVAADGSTDISVTFYIDGVPNLPIPASPYILTVDLGGGRTATSKTFALSEVLDAGVP